MVTRQQLIKILEEHWGKITTDRFVPNKNHKSSKSDPRYLCPGTEDVNSFSFDWKNYVNLLVSPVYILPKTIKYSLKSKKTSKTILVLPYCLSASFWLLLFKDQKILSSFKTDTTLIMYQHRQNYVTRNQFSQHQIIKVNSIPFN